jgi:riboflavin kinase/FMN adenylyltransferase
MQHYRSFDDLRLQNTWLTVGSFDGLHRGHQAIIQRLVQEAHRGGGKAAVLSFYPHPAVVLGRRKEPLYLTTPQERVDYLAGLGVDLAITYRFTPETAALSAYEFMRMLKQHLGLQALYVGENFALGRGREGNIARLRELGGEMDYRVDVIPPITEGEQIVSSTWVRRSLEEGDVALTSRLLGRPFSLHGSVVPGDGRGRTIGIPTANIAVWSERLAPRSGVYACRVALGAQVYPAVANIGTRPTFDHLSTLQHIEAHVLDFDQNLYGNRLRLDFIERLRDEQRFPGVEELLEQIHKDIQQARAILA